MAVLLARLEGLQSVEGARVLPGARRFLATCPKKSAILRPLSPHYPVSGSSR